MAVKDEGLRAVLQAHLPWHRARIKFLALLLITLIGERHVSFTRAASVLTSRSSLVNLRRIQRFFAHYSLNFDSVARLLVAISPIKPPYRLSLDRTHWKFAGVEFNILCLTIVADKVSLPVLWLEPILTLVVAPCLIKRAIQILRSERSYCSTTCVFLVVRGLTT